MFLPLLALLEMPMDDPNGRPQIRRSAAAARLRSLGRYRANSLIEDLHRIDGGAGRAQQLSSQPARGAPRTLSRKLP
jgi:hypothetical protein